MTKFLGPGLAVASGAVWAWCFGRQELLIVPWLALVPLVLLLDRGKSPTRLGLLHGLAFWLISIHWILPTLESYGHLPVWLAFAGLLILAAYLGAYTAAFAYLARRILGGPAVVAVLGLPAVWVSLEALRGWLLTGFPWNLAGYSLGRVPGALPLAAWIGVQGLSFLVVAVNAALALSISRRTLRPALFALAAAVLLLALGRAIAPAPGEAAPDAAQAVKLLQPNSAVLTVYDEDKARADYFELLALSDRACADGPALLVWPESAAWPFSYQRSPHLRGALEDLAVQGCPVLFNSPAWAEGEVYNSAYLVGAAAEPERYDKSHLVPFGEYVPLGNLLPFLDTIARAAGNFSEGDGERLLAWGRERLGMSICFEIVFPGEVARRVRKGATVLATLTNDGWYGDTSAPWQHFRAARFRAAENRRTVLRAAITGVSGVIGPNGAVESQLGVDEQGILSASVAGSTELTFYTRFPWLVPVLSILVAAFAVFPALPAVLAVLRSPFAILRTFRS